MKKWMMVLMGGMIYSACSIAVEADKTERKTFTDNFMTLGTEEGEIYGGDDFVKFDRNQIKHQIKTFIPPLLRPAITQHAYVLPPNTVSISTTVRTTSMDGDDFFKDGKSNKAVFGDFKVDRQLTDLDIFYGFDFNKKYLHGLTLRVNIPYLASQTNGSVNPNGQQFINLENSGSTTGMGDIGLFLKKKLLDQGTSPFGLAIVGAVILPTGSNNETYGSNGRITATRPKPPATDPFGDGSDDAAYTQALAQGFDAVMQYYVGNGTWGDSRCFFSNFNGANRGVCNGPSVNNTGLPFSAPAAAVQSFEPGGPNENNALVSDFPFNNGVFGRFSADGRLPSTLQPGTGKNSYLIGIFATRQFSPGSLIGRAALHVGVNHRFLSKADGIDFGDTTTYFTSFVKPLFRDLLAIDLSFIGFDHEKDSYSGKIPEPGIHSCTQSDVDNNLIAGCNVAGDKVFVFEIQDRLAFSGGFTGYFAPSLIFSPDPQFRLTLSTLLRVIEPDLGPAPETIYRLNMEYAF